MSSCATCACGRDITLVKITAIYYVYFDNTTSLDHQLALQFDLKLDTEVYDLHPPDLHYYYYLLTY